MFSEELKAFRRLGFRHVSIPSCSTICRPHAEIPQVLLQALNFASVLASGLMIWKGLGLITNSESPIVVVLRLFRHWSLRFTSQTHLNIVYSGSMEPAFYRGDLLFLTNPSHERYHNGDITVYKIPGADIPIVHRVLETHDAKNMFASSLCSVNFGSTAF